MGVHFHANMHTSSCCYPNWAKTLVIGWCLPPYAFFLTALNVSLLGITDHLVLLVLLKGAAVLYDTRVYCAMTYLTTNHQLPFRDACHAIWNWIFYHLNWKGTIRMLFTPSNKKQKQQKLHKPPTQLGSLWLGQPRTRSWNPCWSWWWWWYRRFWVAWYVYMLGRRVMIEILDE